MKCPALIRSLTLGATGILITCLLSSCFFDKVDEDARMLAAQAYARRQLQRQYNEYRNEYIGNFSNVTERNPDSIRFKSALYRHQMTDLNLKMDALKREIEALNRNIGATTSEYSRKNNGRDLYELNKEVSAISTLYYK